MKSPSFSVTIVLLLSFLYSAYAVTPDEVLDDPILEERARELSAKLRCLVCQNQSIDDSDAPLAKDLRVLVRQKLVEGNSNVEVLDFVVSKYGEFVLLQPRFAIHTLMLWILTPVILLIGLLTIVFIFRQNRLASHTNNLENLSEEESQKLQQILVIDDNTTSN